MTDTTQAPFTLRDGLNIALYDWPLPWRQRPHAVVLIVHGLGEHAWRHDPLARRLNDWGFLVRAYDQRGHGDSGGRPGRLSDDDDLLEDLLEVVDDTRRHLAEPWACPLILLGHSMGGLVCASFVRQHMAPVDGLVLSSPALDAGLGAWQRWLIGRLYRWAPDLTLGNGLDASKISHNPAVVEAYRKDPRVHDRISARLANFIATHGPEVVEAAPRWTVPTLLMYAGDDHLVHPSGSRRFAQAAPRDRVTSRCFEGYYHEIFNEDDADPVFAELRVWLERRVRAWQGQRAVQAG